MHENIEVALQNCVKLELIDAAAEELRISAGIFKNNANDLRKKLWWKNMKMKLLIGGIVLVIIGVIIAIAVTVSKTN